MAREHLPASVLRAEHSLFFEENKGQVHNQHFTPRPDVLYSGHGENVVFHLMRKGLSYQFYDERTPAHTVYRLDLRWLGANEEVTVNASSPLRGYNIYHLPASGAVRAKHYGKVTYEALYPGIDVQWYEQDGHLKYDYVVAPGADYRQIAMEVTGASHISVAGDGSLVIETPLGRISEIAPVVMQAGRHLKAKWQVDENNTVSFLIDGIDPGQELVIDPLVRSWGTYYGGAALDALQSVTTDSLGNVYACGTTTTSTTTVIATTGAHQTTFGGGSNSDAFLVKFDAGGNRLWATYYGGSGTETGMACATDPAGFVYMAGTASTDTGTVIATTSSHQASYGGGSTDAYLVKFDTAGIRIWATYYGGSGADEGTSCATAKNGNVFLAGTTTSTQGDTIASAGAHQTTHGGGTDDAFLVKFNSSGTRVWGTYYGGSGIEEAYQCIADTMGHVMLCGISSTPTDTAIATAGSHQSAHGGGTYDAFLVRFNGNGVRQWGTYYGGSGEDYGYSCSTDQPGNIYFSGYTTSSSAISTSGSHDNSYASGKDAFLVKFNVSGARQWGTYYGASGDDEGWSCATDQAGNVYLAGITGSSTSIATTGTYDVSLGGTSDAYLVQFNSGGTRQWGTYYGGAGTDGGLSCAIDLNDWIFLAGSTTSTADIASTGSHQDTFGGGVLPDGFLARFEFCTPPTTPTVSLSTGTVCEGDSVIVTVTGSLNSATHWYVYASSCGGTPVDSSASDTFGFVPVLSTTYYLRGEGACVVPGACTFFNITVNAPPYVELGPDTAICDADSLLLDAGFSGLSYVWSNGAFGTYIYVNAADTYSVTVTDFNGCQTKDTIIVSVNPSPTFNLGNDTAFCLGNSMVLYAPPGLDSYAWSTGETTDSIIVDTSSNYGVMVIDSNGCSANDSLVLTVFELPVVNLGPDGNYCGTPTLNAGSGYASYAWNTGATTQTITATVDSTYGVTVTDTNGCQGEDSITVALLAVPTVELGPNKKLCVGGTVTLDAGPGFSAYIWSNAATTQSITVTAAGTYGVTVTAANGCQDNDNVQVTEHQLPFVDLGENQIMCETETIYLNAGAGQTSYLWSTGATTQITAISGTQLGLGSHNISVVVTNANGCEKADTVVIKVNDCLGISEVPGRLDVNLYPNPVTDNVLNINTAENMKLQIHNTAGQLVWKGSVARGITSLSTEGWPAGLYILSDEQGRSLAFAIRE